MIEVKIDGKKVKARKGQTVLQVATSRSIHINAPCGGKGTCTRCKVLVDGKFRKACQTKVREGMVVSIPPETKAESHRIVAEGVSLPAVMAPLVQKDYLRLRSPSLDDNKADLERLTDSLGIEVPLSLLRKLPSALRDSKCKAAVCHDGRSLIDIGSGPLFGLAFDIGTTTIVAQLIDLEKGRIGTASACNPQMSCGEDVLSRITYAEKGGLKQLSKMVRKTMNSLVAQLTKKHKIKPECIVALVCSGNTTMMHLLFEVDPRYIRREPYVPAANQMPLVKAAELGLNVNQNAPVYTVPGIGSYVGGDITADVLASGTHTSRDLSLLIDVGTNGEIALGNGEWLVACSCSAGPAFEGGEVSCGTRAIEGAIERVSIDPDTKKASWTTIDNKRPIGICGSGLIDLMAEMFLVGLIDKAGKLAKGKRYTIVEKNKSGTGKGISISEQDIKSIIRTKGAMYTGASALLKHMGLDFKDLKHVYIAGGFGKYIDVEKAILLGLLPDLPPERFKFMGNGSLVGASLILLSTKKRQEAEEIAKKMAYVELSVDPLFNEGYTGSLFIPHTDIDQFPTVRRLIERKKNET